MADGVMPRTKGAATCCGASCGARFATRRGSAARPMMFPQACSRVIADMQAAYPELEDYQEPHRQGLGVGERDVPRTRRSRRQAARRAVRQAARRRDGAGRDRVQALRHVRLPRRSDARHRRRARLHRRRSGLRQGDEGAARARLVRGLGRGGHRRLVQGSRSEVRRHAVLGLRRHARGRQDPVAARSGRRQSPARRRPDAVLRRIGRANRRRRRHRERRLPHRRRRHAEDAGRHHRPRRQHRARHAQGRRRGHLHRRRSAPRRHSRQPLGDALAAPGAQRGARRARGAEGLAAWRPIACASTSRTSRR